MGFFDKIKDVAKNVTDVATDKLSSVMEERKKAEAEREKAELAKYAADEPIQRLPIIGFVTQYGRIENISAAQIRIDVKEFCLHICIKAKKGPYKYTSIGKDEINSFDEFRYIGRQTRQMTNMTMFVDNYELVHPYNSIKFHTIVSCTGTDITECPKMNNYDKVKFLDLIYPFIHLTVDGDTIKWINDMCLYNDMLPLFDETGEAIIDNMEKNSLFVHDDKE